MKVADFDYHLPESLIAQEPVEPRDNSRLLVLHKGNAELEHKMFHQVLDYVQPGDLLVVNNTKVIPARLFGIKAHTGAKIEVFLLKRLDQNHWEVLVKPGKRARPGTEIVFGEGLLRAVVQDITPAGGRIIEFTYEGVFEEILDQLGQMPLPPYIFKELTDKNRYQTVYAKTEGSAAAPTAGLHFTPELITALKNKGVKFAEVLLHVGLGTFRPVKAETVDEHEMHSEYYEVTPEAAALINETKQAGGRVIAVGTTSTRTIETMGDSSGRIQSGQGWTDIFIYPGYQFKIVDGLITNFHLPKSTLLMLVSAMVGRERLMQAYAEAVRTEYRFFSFGDAMLII